MSIELSTPHAFKDVAVPIGPVRRCHPVTTVSVAAPLCVGHSRSSPPHRLFASRRSTLSSHPVTARLPHQRRPMLPLRHRRAHVASLLGLPAPPSSESMASSSLTHPWRPCVTSPRSFPALTASHPCRLHVGRSWVDIGRVTVPHNLLPLSGSRGRLRRYIGMSRSHVVYPGPLPARCRWGRHARSPCPIHCRDAPPCQGPSSSAVWPRSRIAMVPVAASPPCLRSASARPSAGVQRGRGPPAGLAQCGSRPRPVLC
jgi:hypothetical protein